MLGFCLLGLLFAVNILQIQVADGYPYTFIGCFPEKSLDREFAQSPGLTALGNMTIDKCRFSCAIHNASMSYASISEGKYCFCGDTTGKHGGVEPGFKCGIPCAGNSSEAICGAVGFNAVYNMPVISYEADILTNDVVTSYLEEPFNISLLSSSSQGFTYDVEFTDNSSKISTTNQQITHAVAGQGIQAVEVNITSTEQMFLSTSTTFEVQSKIYKVTLSCPPVIVSGDEVFCKFTVGKGSNMTATFDFGDGTSPTTMYLPDSGLKKYGRIVEKNVLTETRHTSYMYMMNHFPFLKNGTLVGWDFVAAATGAVTLVILRPKCTSAGTQFCMKSYSCIPVTVKCETKTNILAHTCTGDDTYSFQRQSCVDRNTGEVTDKFVSTAWSNLPVTNFEFIGEKVYTIPATGYNMVPLTEAEYIDVGMGDFAAVYYHSSSGRIKWRTEPARMEYRCNPGGCWSNRNTNTYDVNKCQFSCGIAEHSYSHLLRAHVLSKITASVPHKYLGNPLETSFYNTTMTVSNMQKDVAVHSESKYVSVAVGYKVSDVVLEFASAVAKNDVLNISIPTHPGTSVRYQYDLGLGGNKIDTKKKKVPTATLR